MIRFALVFMFVLLAGCTNLGDTIEAGSVVSFEYGGNCETVVATDIYKFMVDGNHVFKPGSRAMITTYEVKGSKSVMMLRLPDFHESYLIVSDIEGGR